MARQTTTTSRAGGTTTTTSKSGVSAASLKAVRELFAEAKKLYAPEGAFMGGVEARVARGEKKAVATGMQGLVAAGLGGTSMMGGLGKKYQEEVAQPALAQAETTRLSFLASLMQSQAGAEAQMAPRYTTQTTTTPYASTVQQTRMPSAPRPREPLPTFKTGEPSTPSPKRTPRGVLNKGPKTLLGMGSTETPQATIGGISYYSAGRGGFTTQADAPTRKQLAKLSSFYSPDLQKSLAAAFTAL